MGTFGGHILPGSFFILFATWWTISLFNRYFRTLNRRSPLVKFRASATFPCRCFPHVPVEGVLKVLFCAIGITGETVTAFDSQGRFTAMVNAHHITMFFFFGVNGVVDIFHLYKLPIPPDSDYVSMVMALSVEGLLFHFHLHGRSDMDAHLHTLLLYTVIASAMVLVVEINHRGNVLVVFLRAFFTLLQGTWFYQIGFILYNPFPGVLPWDVNNHQQIMLVTAIFAWHMAAIIVFMGLIGFMIWLKERPLLNSARFYSDVEQNPFHVETLQSVTSPNDNSEVDEKHACLTSLVESENDF
ncbi:transmembrane protein 45B-like [Tachypleus tridentatus]|uniref:transmembrane protein 45B-like n=1 Tax=Tachypleus tridentatus TaxID=6853 RepID=UPI003FD2FFDB